ncbi:tRNA (adenosine(37)-N6)-threonylcarbamoyltransferase complex ATPase subunit type 1 TsaE [bacterium]|nr:tRNA (adenosine(37)-N6)-threonylcarbamoyltransferase complex ATPase subunit type 1 TsaE [bacterium]MCI0566465.1 tRNA (adenosine(37)-N6)-threonylcarbamoyltransferase complex ATPase subunit type 1 TsaE [bacterium]MCI0680182.1 tRNA (adenosine(37)-N6)-threonylcarbamoyltransferase complex ATPase subunit type 1 TsaE [bacterium]
MKIVSKSEADTKMAAEVFLFGFVKKFVGRGALVAGLSGDLGSGKTTFVKFIAESFGLPPIVQSPTFVIEKVYSLPSSLNAREFRRLIHIDAYRLKDAYELLALGWDDMVKDKENIIFVEWPENVREALPDDANFVRFSHIDDGARGIEWEEE